MCDVVDDDCAVCVPIVHGRQGLVALLSSCVPDLKLDGGILVEGNSLCEECGTDGRFSVGVELVLYFRSAMREASGWPE